MSLYIYIYIKYDIVRTHEFRKDGNEFGINGISKMRTISSLHQILPFTSTRIRMVKLTCRMKKPDQLQEPAKSIRVPATQC